MGRRVVTHRLLPVVLLTVLVTGLSWIGLTTGLFTGFQNRATDALFPAAPRDRRVVVVGVDRATIQAVNDPLPWRRDLWARLVDRLREAGAGVIAFDVVFATPSPPAPAGEADPDVVFANSISEAGNVVLGEGVTKARTPDEGPPVATGATGVFDLFEQHATVGHVQVSQDAGDGVVRRIPMVFDIDGEFVPALSAAAVARLRGEAGPPILRPDGVQVGARLVPTDDTTQLRL